jgi:hypothetical protein
MTNTRIAHRRGRHMVVIDIENMAATPSPTHDDVIAVTDALREAIPGLAAAHIVVACSHRAALEVGTCLPGRHLWRSGPDGADLALLEVLETEMIAERFEHVTVCSGDGIFADTMARLASCGVDAGVVAMREHLSARLRLAVHRVTYLPTHLPPQEPPFAAGVAS